MAREGGANGNLVNRRALAGPELVSWQSPSLPIKSRVVCIPYSGGGAARFREWADGMPGDIELLAVRLPGRENKLREPHLTSLDQIVPAIARDIESREPAPLVIFGHCSGAITALELARELESSLAEPVHVVVAGQTPPEVLTLPRSPHAMTTSDVVAEMRRLGGTDESLLADPDLVEILAPSVRADLMALASFEHPGKRIHSPITCVGGRSDDEVGAADLQLWRSETSGEFELHMLEGDHFLMESWTELAQLVSRVGTSEDTETVVRRIWQATLSSSIKADDDFFDLGGSSRDAAHMVGLIRDELGVSLPISTVYARSKFRDFVRAVVGNEGRSRSQLSAGQRQVGAESPTLRSQLRDWQAQHAAGDSPVLHLFSAYECEGEIEPQALRTAFETVVGRHDALNSNFRFSDGTLTQFVRSADDLDLRIRDTGRIGDGWFREACLAPFDLERSPLFRLVLDSEGRRHSLCFVHNHIVSDLISMGIVETEFAAAYEAALGRQGPEPGLAPLQFGDYTRWWWQREGEGLHDADREFWRETLAAAPIRTPIGSPETGLGNAGAGFSVDLGIPLSQAIRGTAKSLGVTSYAVLLAAFSSVLAEVSGQRHVVMVSGYANREMTELESVVGRFVSSMVLSIETDSEAPFGKQVLDAWNATRDAIGHAEVSVNDVFEQIGLQDHPLPFGNVCFQLLDGEAIGELRLPGLELAPIRRERTALKRDLYVNVEERSTGFVARVEHKLAVVPDPLARRIADGFVALLESQLSGEAAR